MSSDWYPKRVFHTLVGDKNELKWHCRPLASLLCVAAVKLQLFPWVSLGILDLWYLQEL